MESRHDVHAVRERIEAELRDLRRRLADAWWYEKPLAVIEELEGQISARWRRLRELS